MRNKGVNARVINKYVQAYLGDRESDILISHIRRGAKVSGFGVITDVELDALRKYVCSGQTTGLYPLRIGIKVFWLYSGVTSFCKGYTRWEWVTERGRGG
ncbi:hypothetical protein [Metallosphaera tengchongensis]|uniref:hypothetical protein n=1 Tax=Metallosphaera tengchongensis TaxID=1532350 RepID=UPI001C2E4D48|nr:hypothetical protein [Metallosphaera tengchongensis]